MESVLSASKASLISSLDFAGPSGVADYITSRQSIQVFPQGSNIYSPNGVRQLRFSLGTQGAFVDMSSLALQCSVNNESTTKGLTFLGPSLGTCIAECRIFMGNVETERCTFLNRTESLLSRFIPFEKRVEQYDLGFGYSSGTFQGNDMVAAAIPASSSKQVIWRPTALGIVNQKNYIPTAFVSGGGVTIELLLVNTGAEVCDSTGSTTWNLSDAKLLVDVVNCDSSFVTSMSKHLLGGGTLTLAPKLYSTTMFSCSSPSMTLQHVRAYTRLNSAFVTFFKSDANTKKQCNTFYLSPQGQNISIQCQIGEKQTPDNRTDNLAQHYYRLLSAVGLAHSTSTWTITRAGYHTDSFISASDFEAVPEAHGSGISTHNAPMVFDIQNIGATNADLPVTCFILAFHESLIEISQDSVSVAI